jgi:hypothetical protein
MPIHLKFVSQFFLIASICVGSCARRTFLPQNGILIQDYHNRKSISEAIVNIRGGSGRGGYDYNDGYGRDDDYSRGYDYGDRNVGSSRYENDYEDDRYGDDRRGGNDYYDDRDRSMERDYNPSRRSSRSSPSSMPDVGGLLRNGNKKIGIMALGGGVVFTLLGISLFFNKTLMRLGNLLLIVGVPLFIGPGRTTGYFLQPKKARATGCLGLGIFLVFIGWPVFGIALETFGIMNLFGNLFPVLMLMVKQMPIIGNLFDKKENPKRKQSASSRNNYRDSYSYDDEEDDRYANRDDDNSERYY